MKYLRLKSFLNFFYYMQSYITVSVSLFTFKVSYDIELKTIDIIQL